ncbi:carbohydrate kinase family protein [[Clostridium] hylemonae]|uniref:carbohydrate kinase family protein n=1 Tax=[Clostridium] hylemonae TaxID=89153 RepID=UPI001105B1AA|nr:carbohydrate kinase [[Clostridium] hylemonae]
MMKKYDVLTMGEALVDFVPEENRVPGPYRALAGGAPNNVACGLGKLGARVALLARVGDDALGRCVIDTAGECGVDTSYIQTDRRRVTTVTVVMPRSEDMTRYAIYRKESADGALTFEDIPTELFDNAKILHYGSLGMAEKTSSECMGRAIRRAREKGMTTSLDVNLRPGSWDSQDEMISRCRELVRVSDIIKLTKEEAEILRLNPRKLAAEEDKIVLMTDGAETASVYAGKLSVSRRPEAVEAVDVTGGGDSFMSAFLYYYGAFAEKMEAEEFYANAVDFAVRASTIAVQRYGAIDSLPTLEEICEKGGRMPNESDCCR